MWPKNTNFEIYEAIKIKIVDIRQNTYFYSLSLKGTSSWKIWPRQKLIIALETKEPS